MGTSDFYRYIVDDRLSRLPGVIGRAMFGGYGIYRDGFFFAIIADNNLYFKVDETNLSDFEGTGSRPFTYKGPGGRPMEMGYWLVPAWVIESDEHLVSWVEKAVEVSRRAKLKKSR